MIALFRDIRGLIETVLSKNTFGLIFEWLFPYHRDIFVQTVQAFHHDPLVMVAMMKCLNELAYNRTQRMKHDESIRCNGLLLFRIISKTIVTYGMFIILNKMEFNVISKGQLILSSPPPNGLSSEKLYSQWY